MLFYYSYFTFFYAFISLNISQTINSFYSLEFFKIFYFNSKQDSHRIFNDIIHSFDQTQDSQQTQTVTDGVIIGGNTINKITEEETSNDIREESPELIKDIDDVLLSSGDDEIASIKVFK